MSDEAKRVMDIFFTDEEKIEIEKAVDVLRKYGFSISIEEE